MVIYILKLSQSNIICFSMNIMQQSQRSISKNRNCVANGEVKIKIKMDPKSLSMTVPLNWQINKIKCILSSLMPKLQFNMITFLHDSQVIPGHLTLQEVLDVDEDEQCLLGDQYVLNFQRTQAKLLEFQKYYASKMIPLLSSIKQSPYQPLLHPKYYALQSEIVQMSEMSGQNIKVNLQSLLNLRTLLNNINQNRPQQQQGRERAQNQANVGVVNPGGAAVGNNLFGLMPGDNRNIFEWIMFFVFKFFQIMILWQFIQIVLAYISKWHVLTIALIGIFYFYIQYYQRQRNLQQQQQQQQPRNQEVQTQRKESQFREATSQQKQHQEKPTEEQLNEESENKNTNQINLLNQLQQEKEKQADPIEKQSQNKGNQSKIQAQQIQNNVEQKREKGNPVVFKSLIAITEFLCLLGQCVIGFTMSLFPNWNIQLHHNILRRPFDYIDSFMQSWSKEIQVPANIEAQKEE